MKRGQRRIAKGLPVGTGGYTLAMLKTRFEGGVMTGKSFPLLPTLAVLVLNCVEMRYFV